MAHFVGKKDLGRIEAVVNDSGRSTCDERVFKPGQETAALAWAYETARIAGIGSGAVWWSVRRWEDLWSDSSRALVAAGKMKSQPYRYGYVLLGDDQQGYAVEGLTCFVLWARGEDEAARGLCAFVDNAITIAEFGPLGPAGREMVGHLMRGLVNGFHAAEWRGVKDLCWNFFGAWRTWAKRYYPGTVPAFSQFAGSGR